MEFDYKKLKERIKEVFGTQERFANTMKWSNSKTNKRLNNKSYFFLDEIVHCVNLLNIPSNEISSYFFTVIKKEPELSNS